MVCRGLEQHSARPALFPGSQDNSTDGAYNSRSLFPLGCGARRPKSRCHRATLGSFLAPTASGAGQGPWGPWTMAASGQSLPCSPAPPRSAFLSAEGRHWAKAHPLWDDFIQTVSGGSHSQNGGHGLSFGGHHPRTTLVPGKTAAITKGAAQECGVTLSEWEGVLSMMVGKDRERAQ